jgi:RND family efflux transporter MFP subunit
VSAQERERLKSEDLAARARVEAAASDLTAAELKLRYTRVVAPDDGVVTSRTVVVGQIAQAGGEMLKLLRQGRIEWRAEVPEARMRDVKAGQTARVTTADGAELKGTVRTVAPTVQSGTRTGLVYVDLPKTEGARPGMFARGEIEVSKSNAATLPLASVVVRDGFSYVFVVNEKQGVERRRVQTGTVRNGRVELLSGVTPGDRVVERGAGFLKDGDSIRVVESDDTKPTSVVRTTGSGGTT